MTLYVMQRTTSSLLQTFIKQAGLVVVCKDNNSVSGNRDRSLASRPESINSYSFSAGPVIGPQLLQILHKPELVTGKPSETLGLFINYSLSGARRAQSFH